MSRTDDTIAAAVASAPIATWEKLLDRVELDPASGCRLWTARLDKSGYGLVALRCPYGGWPHVRAHRVSFALFHGMDALPEGKGRLSRHDLVLDHICRQRSCINPLHLRAIPARLNAALATGNPRFVTAHLWRSDGF